MPFDDGPVLDGENPVRHQLVLSGRLASGLEHRLPDVSSLGVHRTTRVLRSHVLANRVVLVAVNPAFALFEVHRIGRQVPVNHCVTVGMKIKPFLTDRRCNEHERPEGRVKRILHLLGSSLRSFFVFLVPKTHGKANPHALRLHGNLARSGVCLDLCDPKTGSTQV